MQFITQNNFAGKTNMKNHDRDEHSSLFHFNFSDKETSLYDVDTMRKEPAGNELLFEPDETPNSDGSYRRRQGDDQQFDQRFRQNFSVKFENGLWDV